MAFRVGWWRAWIGFHVRAYSLGPAFHNGFWQGFRCHVAVCDFRREPADTFLSCLYCQFGTDVAPEVVLVPVSVGYGYNCRGAVGG